MLKKPIIALQTVVFCLFAICLGVSVAHATLAGTTYSAFANEAGTTNQISTTGTASTGLASASVFDNSMYAGYTGVGNGSGAGAGMYWTAPADTTFRVVFGYTITNPLGNNNTSFVVSGLNPSTYDVLFNIITYSGSGNFDQTLSLKAGEQLSIMANAVGPDGNGGLAVNLTNLDVSAVPIPGAVYLLGPGLVGLVGLRRRFQFWWN